MLSVNKIGGYYNSNSSKGLKKQEVSFSGGAVLAPVGKWEVVGKLFELKTSKVIESLDRAVAHLPELADEAALPQQEANGFFRNLLTTLKANPNVKLIGAIGDSLGLPAGSHQRNMADDLFVENFSALENNANYQGFIENLSKGAFGKINKTIDPFEEGRANMLRKENKRPVSPRAAAFREKRAELDCEVQPTIIGFSDRIGNLGHDLDVFQRETRGIKSKLEIALEKEQWKINKSPFLTAEHKRNGLLAEIKSLLSRYIDNKDYTVLLSRHKEKKSQMPLAKWERKEHKLRTAQEKQAQNFALAMPEIRQKRREIAILDQKYPGAKTIFKKMEQIKRFLTFDSISNEELKTLEKKSAVSPELEGRLESLKRLISKPQEFNKQSKELINLRKQLNALVKENDKLAKFAKTEQRVAIDYETRFIQLEKEKPSIGSYKGNTKFFNQEMNRWNLKYKKLTQCKAAAAEYFKNEALIAQIKQKMAQLSAKPTSNADNIDERLVSQIKRTKAHKAAFESKLKKFEQKKKDLIDANKGIWELETHISQLKDEKNIFANKSEKLLQQQQAVQKTKMKVEKNLQVAKAKVDVVTPETVIYQGHVITDDMQVEINKLNSILNERHDKESKLLERLHQHMYELNGGNREDYGLQAMQRVTHNINKKPESAPTAAKKFVKAEKPGIYGRLDDLEEKYETAIGDEKIKLGEKIEKLQKKSEIVQAQIKRLQTRIKKNSSDTVILRQKIDSLKYGSVMPEAVPA